MILTVTISRVTYTAGDRSNRSDPAVTEEAWDWPPGTVVPQIGDKVRWGGEEYTVRWRAIDVDWSPARYGIGVDVLEVRR